MTSHAITVTGFVVLGLVLAGLGVASHLPRSRVPTITSLLRTVMRRRTGRIAILLAWWWVGWHFFAR